MKNCPYCGEEIQDSAKKCRYCGEWILLKENHEYVKAKKSNLNNGYSFIGKTKKEQATKDKELLLIGFGIVCGICFLIYLFNYFSKLDIPSCETLYNNFVSNNKKIGFIENNIKISSKYNCVAYISIVGEINNQNEIDLNLGNGYSIDTVGNSNRNSYCGFLVIDLDNELFLTGTLVRLPNEEDINFGSSASSFNNIDIAKSNAINYFNSL